MDAGQRLITTAHLSTSCSDKLKKKNPNTAVEKETRLLRGLSNLYVYVFSSSSSVCVGGGFFYKLGLCIKHLKIRMSSIIFNGEDMPR